MTDFRGPALQPTELCLCGHCYDEHEGQGGVCMTCGCPFFFQRWRTYWYSVGNRDRDEASLYTCTYMAAQYEHQGETVQIGYGDEVIYGRPDVQTLFHFAPEGYLKGLICWSAFRLFCWLMPRKDRIEIINSGYEVLSPVMYSINFVYRLPQPKEFDWAEEGF